MIESVINDYLDKKELLVDVDGGNGYTTSKLLGAGYHAVLIELTPSACLK